MNELSQKIVFPEPGSQIAGFWRRLFAFIIDCVLLGIVGFIIGLFFYDYLADLGGRGRVIGFFIALFYFGIMNSRIYNGQTIGKALVKVRVVGSDGSNLGIGSSFLRSAVFCLPYFLGGMPLQGAAPNVWIGYLLFLLVFGCGISIIYLFVFNRTTRQSLHDLVVASYVVKANAQVEPPSVSIWHGHYAVLATIIVVSLLGPLFVPVDFLESFGSLAALQKEIANDPLIQDVGITANTTWSTGGKGSARHLSVRVTTRARNTDFESLANRLAKTILDKHPDAASRDVIAVSISYGYDIGIASSWRTMNYVYTPEQWKQRLLAKSA